VTLILDAGALVAFDRGDREVAAILRVAHRTRVPVRTSAGVVAQVWRNGARQAGLARILAGIDVVPLDRSAGRTIGELLAAAGSSDVIDGHVAILAKPDDTVLTGDIDDIARLLDTRRVEASLVRA
jgi:hypothetical protein